MTRQRTLRNSIRATGSGLRTGDRADLVLRPAAPDTGIVFRRVDLAEPVEIPARVENASSSLLSISLRRGDIAVSAVERLLAAAAGLGIDNMYVDIDGSEVPALDGSASPFVFLIQSAGIDEQSAPRRFIRVLRAIEVAEGRSWARLEPYPGLRIALRAEAAPVGRRSAGPHAVLEVTETAFIKEVSRARSAQARDEARGVAHAPRPMDLVESPRFDNEHIRSRIVSALGALNLAGGRILGALEGCASTHSIHLRLVRALLADPGAWDWTAPADGASLQGSMAQASSVA